MAERDRYIPGVPCWADTTQPDPDAAAEFYGGLFGWEFERLMPPGSASATSRLDRRQARGGDQLGQAGGPRRRRPGTCTSGSRAPTRRPRRSATPAAAVVTEPMDVMDAGRMATFTDPEGAAFGVWQPNEHRGAEVINEHGGVNFNDLNTRDVEAAKAFYGAVFGWEALAMEGGFQMWILPGYGDFLEEFNPGTRRASRDGRAGALRGRRRLARADR